MEFKHVTTKTYVELYGSSNTVFSGLLKEVRELSKKKPEATISPGKIKIINRVLEDLILFLSEEPEGKYLERLDKETLPQMSDAVLVMVQFETALASYKRRYFRRVDGDMYWITKELLEEWEAEDSGEIDAEDELY